MFEQLVIGTVISSRKPAFGNRHADADRNTLSERTSGGFHAGGPSVLGMPGAATPGLTKTLKVIE